MKLLEKLIILDGFMKENDVEYFLLGGSALGAVRHQGFIPWDDDIDIGMFREEFERFETLDFTVLKENYDLEYCKIGKNVILNAPIGFLYDRSDEDIPYEECITIDIFPIDNVPKSRFKQRIQKILSHIYHLSVGRRPAKNRGIKARIFTTVIVKIMPGFMFSLFEKFAKRAMIKIGGKQSDLVSNIFGQKGYYRETVPKEYMEQTIEMPFEGHMFPVQANYHIYLTHIYGDYMKLPPEDQQKPHHKEFEE